MIYFLLKTFKEFNRFTNFYGITDEILKILIPNLKYKFMAKNSFVNEGGENSTKFYWLIKGKLEVKKSRKARSYMNFLKKKTFDRVGLGSSIGNNNSFY